MYRRLAEQFGEAQIEEIIKTNVADNVTEQAMQIVNAFWDNREQLEATVEEADQPSGDLPDEGA